MKRPRRGKMAPTAPPERQAEMNLYVICIFNINKEGFNGVSLIKTDIYFVLGCVWFAATSIKRNGRGITARPDRHFKTNHRLAYPSCPHVDQQIQRTGSLT